MADYYELDPSLNSEKREAGPSTLTDKNLQEALLVLEKREKEVDTLRQQLSEVLYIIYKALYIHLVTYIIIKLAQKHVCTYL